MQLIPNIDLEKYHYELHDDRIAKYPLKDRAESKLLVVEKSNNTVKHSNFHSIVDYIPKNSLIFVNDTKVLPARIHLKKSTGGRAELFLLDPLMPSHDPQITLNSKKECIWKCMIGGKKIKEGIKLILNSHNFELKVEVIQKQFNIAECKFIWNGNHNFGELLEIIGNIPLPPYLNREIIETDKDDYQTIFSHYDGSVAAPTAGLHFTDEILSQLKLNNEIINLTLHVGAGTFLPISSNSIQKHKMHREQVFIKKDRIKKILLCKLNNENNKLKQNIIATGTTSVRTLESLYYIGKKLYYGQNNLNISQWEAYIDENKNISVTDSLRKILEYMTENDIELLNFFTDIIIIPGFEFKIIDGMITNFHQSKSTLILLVVAFLGYHLWKKAYDEALNNEYRFLSYGDSSLLLT